MAGVFTAIRMMGLVVKTAAHPEASRCRTSFEPVNSFAAPHAKTHSAARPPILRIHVQGLNSPQGSEFSLRGAILLLNLCKQADESRTRPDRLQPRVAKHGGIAEEPSCHDAVELVKRNAAPVQMSQMARQVVEAFRIAEVGGDNALHRGNACFRVSLDQ